MSPDRGIGLLSLGERSTAYYLSRICELSGARAVPVLLEEMNFDIINKHLPCNFPELEPALQDGLNRLSECDVVVIPNMTLHETFDRLPTLSAAARVIHPVDETLACLGNAQADNAVVLGSAHTMTSPYWADALRNMGVNPTSASGKTVAIVDAFRLKVYARTETAEDVKIFQDRILEYSHVCPVIVACTELSMFTEKKERNIFDAAEIQIKTAIHRVSKTE